MRPDMFKVIVERPRSPRGPSVGSAYPRGMLEARWAPSLEDAPRLEAMGRPYESKYLNENLAPLRRYLRSNVGRRWNKVRSEMSAHLSCKSAVQKHVLDHLKDYVYEHVWLEGKQPYSIECFGAARPIGSYRNAQSTFYVCPRSGLLRLAPPSTDWRRRPSDPWRDRVFVPFGKDGRDGEYRLIDGIWYALTFAPIPATHSDAVECYDALAKVYVYPPLCTYAHNPLWSTGRYVVKKAQANSRVIAKLGLPRKS